MLRGIVVAPGGLGLNLAARMSGVTVSNSKSDSSAHRAEEFFIAYSPGRVSS